MRSKTSGANRRLLYLKGIERNARQQMDAVELLSRIPDRLASLFTLDPQYRAVLDQLSFGNEGARQSARAKLKSMDDDTIAFVIEEGARVLKPSGIFFLWMDKFSLASGHWHRWIRRSKSLQVVDLLAWNKMRPGMGRRLRCVTEYMVVLQKEPTRAKGCWQDHGIRDAWSESSDRRIHPHAKPYVLTERLIRATTKPGDVVIDPCAGGFGVLDACLATGRTFIGGDIAGDD